MEAKVSPSCPPSPAKDHICWTLQTPEMNLKVRSSSGGSGNGSNGSSSSSSIIISSPPGEQTTTTKKKKKQHRTELVPKPQIKKAVETLLKHPGIQKNNLLLSDYENIFLMVVLWKIPQVRKKIGIPLPFSIRHDTVEVCLFTRDEPKLTAEQTENHYRKLLGQQNVNISQVIPFKTLKTEYKPFEAKRRLLNSFSVFLCDDRIKRLLPSHLGKHFYLRKKDPLPVNMTCANLAQQLQKVIQGTSMAISNRGGCSSVQVGHTGMKIKEIVANVISTVEVLSEKLPEKWKNVKMIYMKTERSVSLPIFSSFLNEFKDLPRPAFAKPKKQKETQGEMKAEKIKASKKPAPRPEVKKQRSAGPGAGVPSVAGLEKEQKEKAKTTAVQEQEPEEEIPQLIPIQIGPSKKTPRKAKPEEKWPKKSLGVQSPQSQSTRQKRKVSVTELSPKEMNQGTEWLDGPAKRLRISEVTKQETPLSLRKATRKKTPRKPESSSSAAPDESPGKKPRISEVAEQETPSSLRKATPKKTPKKPEASFFVTPHKNPGKKARILEVAEQEILSSLSKATPKVTPKKPEASSSATPDESPGKTPRISEVAEQETPSSLGKATRRRTPRKPEASFFVTPHKRPGKKATISEVAEQETPSSLRKATPKKTPRKPEARSFATPNKGGRLMKSARKPPRTPKQNPKKPQVPQSA
ncbi:ribosomal L1 domain-containing protein 1 [Ornithorhynchus anatinus]|uniref:ribosomal L1 domain-containing protein 1 n=1 Tax=Ornithorhynchus anatinus TaxID=9258 RepID=UPI0010A76E66|nr:ribosomal L1 domain-containing protein 1 [Ornithorhynchus anatinus]